MTTATTPTPPDPIAARSLAERARDAFETARRKVSDLRLARARGGNDAPTADEIAKAKAAAELAEDRATLAKAEAEAAERDAAVAAALAAWDADCEARRLAAAEHDRLNAEFIAKLHGLVEHLAVMRDTVASTRDRFGLDNRFSAGVMIRATDAVASVWPVGLPFPRERTRHGTADRFVEAERLDLAERLPMPLRPAAPGSAAEAAPVQQDAAA